MDHYTKILLPARDLVDKMRREIENPFTVLKSVQYRVEWERAQQREKQREDELAEKERVAYAQIDWHDFVVVETVDYQPGETGNFPPPTTPQDVGARIIAMERIDAGGGHGIDNAHLLGETIILDESRVDVNAGDHSTDKQNQMRVLIDKNMDQVAMDEESDDEEKVKRKPETEKPKEPSSMAAPPQPGNIIIRKDYDPKQKQPAAAKSSLSSKAASGEEMFRSPLTGELIPASMMSEHMRISMLDPRWIEQKQREKKEREEQEEVLASGIHIEKHLKRLAEYRSDMFGSGAEETLIGRKKGLEAESSAASEPVTWDGYSSTADVTSKRAMTGISVEDQIKAIHQSQGLLDVDSSKIGPSVINTQQPPRMPFPPQMPPKPVVNLAPPINPVVPQFAPPPVQPPPPAIHQFDTNEDLPASKRLKTAEESLVPEKDFLALHDAKGPVRFHVQLPVVPEKPEWNLNGQTITLVLPLTETVRSIDFFLNENNLSLLSLVYMYQHKLNLFCENLF